MRLKMKSLIALVLALSCSSAFSSGAPWFKWKNVVNHTILCAQNSPGDAWQKFQGPYMEGRCRKEGMPQ